MTHALENARYRMYKVSSDGKHLGIAVDGRRIHRTGYEDMVDRLAPIPAPTRRKTKAGIRKDIVSRNGVSAVDYVDSVRKALEEAEEAGAHTCKLPVKCKYGGYGGGSEYRKDRLFYAGLDDYAHIPFLRNTTCWAPVLPQINVNDNPWADNWDVPNSMYTYLLVTTDAKWWKWLWSSMYDYLDKRPIGMITDNISYRGEPSSPGGIMRYWLGQHLQGVDHVVTNSGRPLYFKVIPHLAGNSNHGDRDTFMAFYSRSPIELRETAL
jgi:hypothetical protein